MELEKPKINPTFREAPQLRTEGLRTPDAGSTGERIEIPQKVENLRSESSPQELQSNSGAGASLPVVPLPAPKVVEPKAQAISSPAIANDDDLIEKEWVAKAKAIVDDTKSDPYEQESAMSKLQADYLKKRYGKEVTLSDK